MKTKSSTKPGSFFLVGVLGAMAVALGALGAHFLKSKLGSGSITLDQLNGFDTAVKYQMYHVIAMMVIVFFRNSFHSRFLTMAYRLFFWGIVLFSGSLYLLCTRQLLGADWLKFLGPVTPIGGVLFVAGWLCLSCTAFEKKA